MAYSTPEMVRLVLSSVDTEYGGTAADLSDEQIQYEIDGAQADIDSRLRTRYVVPFDMNGDDNVPFLIVQIATDMAAYKADLNFRKSREYDNENMPIMLRWKDAHNLLENLRRGRNTLNWPREDINDWGALVVNPPDGPFIPWDSVREPNPRW